MQTLLKQRSPEQWAEHIALLPKKIRTQIAKVVWWDWFGPRVVSERWDHLDQYINQPAMDLEDHEVLEGLELLGYTEKQARQRLYPDERVREPRKGVPKGVANAI
jgi:hypothetical protein